MILDIEYADMLGSSLNVFAKERPAVPAAKRRMKEIEIPGRDGKVYQDDGGYEPTEIKVVFNFRDRNEDKVIARFRKIQRWLSAKESRLIFSDDTEVYYRISKVEVGELERTSGRIGNFTATFHTRDGLAYAVDGRKEYSPEQVKKNIYGLSHPVYKITGEGSCMLTVNGHQMKVNVHKSLMIDTDRILAYSKDGTLQNAMISGEYEDMYLLYGDNDVSISPGFDLKVIPNWRYDNDSSI